MPQLQIFVPEKVDTIGDVMQSTNRGWDIPYIVFSCIPIQDVLIGASCNYLRRFFCEPYEKIIISKRGVLLTSEVHVYKTIIIGANYHVIHSLSCGEVSETRLPKANKWLIIRHWRSCTIYRAAESPWLLYKATPGSFATITMSEVSSQSRTRSDVWSGWNERAFCGQEKIV